MQRSYNPDVLSCLANLSNDEVFTPPQVVNRMLDMLPPELWSNPQATFLDPVCKTGVFLCEVAKRLMVGLADRIPDVQERVNHIMTCQLFGLAITELTSPHFSLAATSIAASGQTANTPFALLLPTGRETFDIRPCSTHGNRAVAATAVPAKTCMIAMKDGKHTPTSLFTHPTVKIYLCSRRR